MRKIFCLKPYENLYFTQIRRKMIVYCLLSLFTDQSPIKVEAFVLVFDLGLTGSWWCTFTSHLLLTKMFEGTRDSFEAFS